MKSVQTVYFHSLEGNGTWLMKPTVEGVCEGTISTTPRGDRGFGYDPVFVVAGMNRTMAELDREAKNAVSHRGRALARLRPYLVRLVAG